ncbi:MAG: ATP-binding protein [Candidatus Contendobacter odensis]|uniref:ATP-binding protein n=1 Tax=Candidatus Contendibacter odensensis TaxID=1400860 RepID=A0A2G6PGR5_9GAMM|nr:MAG: ATP-binding protein [Candidatus Contendobacter odensis]
MLSKSSLKSFLHRRLSDTHALRTHKRLRFLGDLLHDPRVWHFSRRPTVRGLAAGAFFAFVPCPWQMILVAITAAWLRFNLPVAVAMVWITNPITIPPLAFLTYKFGAWLLGRPLQEWMFEPSFEWLMQRMGDIGLSFLVGSFATAILAGIFTFCIAHLFWRWRIINKFRKRRRMVTACPG